MWRRHWLVPATALAGVSLVLVAVAAAVGRAASSPSEWLERYSTDRSRGGLRFLQASSSGDSAGEAEPSLDEVHNVFFSRPPYSEQARNAIVYYVFAGIYVICGIVLLIGVNLDAAERRRRLARALVPQEFVSHRLLCCKVTLPQENVPCEITEQYYLDSRLLAMRNEEEVDSRKQRIGFWGYLLQYAMGFWEVLMREHLMASFFVRAVPTFTRMKRGCLMVLKFHLCMLSGAMVYNAREHQAPKGRYELFTCRSEGLNTCFPTVPAAILFAAVACPVFRYLAHRQMRLTCFVSQSHPSTSQFPLGTRKFAMLPPKSVLESLLCMRNGYERHKARVTNSRTCLHRAVHALWLTTQSTIKDLRFYNTMVSWCILTVVLFFIAGSAAYVLLLTVYMKDAAVYHWLLWIAVSVICWVLIFEPLLLLWTEVLWCSMVATVAQYWGYGGHALAATTKYKHVVKEVEDAILKNLRNVASMRIQRFWKGTLDMYKQVNEQNAAATKIQTVRKKQTQKKKFIKERKWCMKVEVIDCGDFEEIFNEEMNPFIRLKCDVGNPNVNETKVAWAAGRSATFNETFFVDIKESNSMTVTAWTKGLTMEEFLGRGAFDFNTLKAHEEKADVPEGHMVRVELAKNQTGGTRSGQPAGFVNLRVTFLDPYKDQCGNEDGEDWMLPKNRMKFTLSKMGPGGNVKVGKMLGTLNPGQQDRPGDADPSPGASSSSTAAPSARPPAAAASSTPYRPNAAGAAAASSSGAAPGAASSSSAARVRSTSAERAGSTERVPAAGPAQGAAATTRLRRPSDDAPLPPVKAPRRPSQQLAATAPAQALEQPKPQVEKPPLVAFVVENHQLEAQAPGVAYRSNKRLEDHMNPPQAAFWGVTVEGVDEGDGWLKIGEGPTVKYLPMMVQGQPVLRRLAPGAAAAAPATSTPAASTSPSPPRLAGTSAAPVATAPAAVPPPAAPPAAAPPPAAPPAAAAAVATPAATPAAGPKAAAAPAPAKAAPAQPDGAAAPAASSSPETARPTPPGPSSSPPADQNPPSAKAPAPAPVAAEPAFVAAQPKNGNVTVKDARAVVAAAYMGMDSDPEEDEGKRRSSRLSQRGRAGSLGLSAVPPGGRAAPGAEKPPSSAGAKERPSAAPAAGLQQPPGSAGLAGTGRVQAPPLGAAGGSSSAAGAKAPPLAFTSPGSPANDPGYAKSKPQPLGSTSPTPFAGIGASGAVSPMSATGAFPKASNAPTSPSSSASGAGPPPAGKPPGPPPGKPPGGPPPAGPAPAAPAPKGAPPSGPPLGAKAPSGGPPGPPPVAAGKALGAPPMGAPPGKAPPVGLPPGAAGMSLNSTATLRPPEGMGRGNERMPSFPGAVEEDSQELPP